MANYTIDVITENQTMKAKLCGLLEKFMGNKYGVPRFTAYSEKIKDSTTLIIYILL